MNENSTPKDTFAPVSDTTAESQGPKLIPQQTAGQAAELRLAENALVPDANPRQQRKIIRYLTSVDPMPGFFKARDVPIREGEHDNFLGDLRDGKIKQEKVNKMLASIASPLDLSTDPESRTEVAQALLQDLQQEDTPEQQQRNSQARAILAKFTRGTIDARNDLTPEDIINFHDSHQLPSTFELQDGKQFLDELGETNGPEKRSEHEQSMQRLLKIYGKRNDYWQQFKLMQQEAGANSQPTQET